jgi:hypothetical protein
MNCSALKINQKYNSDSRSPGAQPIFFPQIHENKYITTFGSPTAQEICSCSNYSIRRWSFLFIQIKDIDAKPETPKKFQYSPKN